MYHITVGEGVGVWGRGRVTVVRWEGGSALLKLMQSRRHLLLELSLKDALLTHYLTHY